MIDCYECGSEQPYSTKSLKIIRLAELRQASQETLSCGGTDLRSRICLQMPIEPAPCLAYSYALKIEATYYSETPVDFPLALYPRI